MLMMFFMCQTRMADVVDVVYVKAKGGPVAGRPVTRVDGYSPPRAKKLVLQVSKYGVAGSKGLV
jgi:hypothetical protein